MPVLNIDGQRVTVNDSFMNLSPDEQNKAVDEIARSIRGTAAPGALDKYQQAAQADIARNPQIQDTGFTRRLVHGATFGLDNPILAGMETPIEMYRQGTWNPVEGFKYAKAREDELLNQSRAKTGLLGTAAEVFGGGVSAGGLAQGGVTAGRFLAPTANIFKRALASAADNAAIGGISGAADAKNLNELPGKAATGAAIGGLVGAATPLATSVAQTALSPITSQIAARINPAGYAESQVGRAIQESGRTPDQISLDMLQAANEGQPQFNLADALGNPGQRMLSTVARAPGEGRTAVVDALEGRQAGQGRRVASALAEGFHTPETAAQTEARLTAARDATADREYSQVRNDALPVDVTGAVRQIDRTISPATTFGTNIAPDSAEAALLGFRRRLTDGTSNLTDFPAVQRVRGDLGDAVQAAQNSGAGNKARLLRGVLRELDAAMENSSAGHLAANRNYAQASRNIDAVQQGRDAAMRGRTEDTIPAYQALSPQGQAAFRSGYADPLIGQTQAAAFGANKARPLTGDWFQDEGAAIAPGNDMMQRRIARENTMFDTRQQATGGSRTADNFADQAAMGVDPHLIGQIVAGNWHGAAHRVLAMGHNALNGNTAQVRQEIANILLRNGTPPAQLRQMVDNTVQRLNFVNNIARGIGRGVAGGATVEANQ